jgi:hypothetical protein
LIFISIFDVVDFGGYHKQKGNAKIKKRALFWQKGEFFFEEEGEEGRWFSVNED